MGDMGAELGAEDGAITSLVTFDGANGAAPYGGLIADENGNLYGTTSYGGPRDAGTVFRINIGEETLTTLATFDVANGLNPYGTLVADEDGNLYGTTWAGGASGYGTVFRVTAGTHALATLVTFDGTNGADPFGGLIRVANGEFYGTTNWGGAFSGGTIFKLSLIPEPGAIVLMSCGAMLSGFRHQFPRSRRRD